MRIRLSKPLAIDILFVSKFPSCTRSLSAIPPPPLPAPYGCLRLALPPLLKAEETERKAEETKEKEKKSKGGVSCPPHDNCFYIIKVALLGGRACGCAYLFRVRCSAPERRIRANVKGGKAVYIPLTFARAAIMGGGRGIGLNGGDKLGWGGDRHGEGDERRAQGRGGAHDKPSTTGADKPRARAHGGRLNSPHTRANCTK